MGQNIMQEDWFALVKLGGHLEVSFDQIWLSTVSAELLIFLQPNLDDTLSEA